MLHVYVKPVIAIYHVILLKRYNQAKIINLYTFWTTSIENTVHVLYNVCFW